MKSWVEVSAARLAHNLHAVQSITGAAVETLAVIKANGYGHDAALVARVLVDAGALWLGVTDVEEAARVRAAVGGKARLMVMSGLEAADTKSIVNLGLTPVVWTAEHISGLERAAEAAGEKVRVHLEIDTGMARQGVAFEGLAKVAERLAGSRWVVCEGVMSHLSSAEDVASEVTARQRERFGQAIEVIATMGLRPEFLHLGNTSAVDEESTMKWTREAAERIGARAMVRTGLALYGFCLPLSTETTGALAELLEPVLTWKTRVIGVREIQAGDTVGYGATFRAKSMIRLGLLPVGYADGFRREASTGMGDGWVVIAGRRAPVVGRVSMNLTTVDVTDFEEVGVGDEVVLLGDGVSAEDHAWWSGTIPYDILCGIRARFCVQ